MASRKTARVIGCLAVLTALSWAVSALRAPRAEVVEAAGGVGALNEAPNAIFLVSPGPDESGNIVGPTPFTVTFNLCRSTDPDRNDELKYRYDLEGEGVFSKGRCRESHTYDNPRRYKATACVSDFNPDHEVCETFVVDAVPGPPQPQPTVFFTTNLVYASTDGDNCANYVSIPWSLASALGAATPRVWVPLADTDGDRVPDSIVFDLDGDGRPDPGFQQSGRLAGGCTPRTSISRMVGPTYKILIDTDGVPGPSEGDDTVKFVDMGGSFMIKGPWSEVASSADVVYPGNPDDFGVATSITQFVGFKKHVVTASQFSNGGASRIGFEEYTNGGLSSAGYMDLLDSDSDGIFDQIQAMRTH